MHSQGVLAKCPPTPPSAFIPISDKDMTEIELHTVDSISDLHRTHNEQHSKGVRPPRPQPPCINGNLQMMDRPAVCQTAYRTKGSSQISNLWNSSRWRYSLTCIAVLLILLSVILILSFLVQQSKMLHRLAETLSQRQETAGEISIILQELQALRQNLTGLKIPH